MHKRRIIGLHRWYRFTKGLEEREREKESGRDREIEIERARGEKKRRIERINTNSLSTVSQAIVFQIHTEGKIKNRAIKIECR